MVGAFVKMLLLFEILLVTSHFKHVLAAAPENYVAFGSCPDVPSQKDFSLTKFEGVWQVLHQFSNNRFLNCQNFTFTSVEGKTLSMKIEAQADTDSYILLKTRAQSVSLDELNPGVMRWNWNYFPSFVDQVTVVNTDYNTFALLLLCSDYGLIHTNYVVILKRPSLLGDDESYDKYVDKAKEVLSPYVHLPRYSYPRGCEIREEGHTNEVHVGDTIKEVAKLFAKFIP